MDANSNNVFPSIGSGGKMGSLISKFDWSATSIGHPDQWPQSLRTTLGTMLHSPFPMFLCWGPELICFYNDSFRPCVDQGGKQPDIMGMSTRSSWPDGFPITQPLIKKVLEEGGAIWNKDQLVPICSNGRIKNVHWTFCYCPVFDETGVIAGVQITCTDITDLKLQEMRLRESAEKHGRLAAIVNTSDDAIISKTLKGIITSWNMAAERMFGYTQEEVLGKHISLLIPPAHLNEEEYIIGQVVAGLKVDHFETMRLTKDGRLVPLSITVSPVMDDDGTIIGASKIARDISIQQAAQQLTRRYTERLEIMNMMVKSVSEELDLRKILQKVTDSTTELTGAKFGAFFYNTVNEKGDIYMLYTLSGAAREDFDQFGMPHNTAIFHLTFSGQGIIRSDDITKDSRYGKSAPHYGMPKGHLPVVSYLAVPVISHSGSVMGGLFFGHPEPGRFTKDHEMLVESIAAQAAIGIDNAKLFEEVKVLNLKKDEFIGLASHELKTPLTSISGYLQILSRLELTDHSRKFVEKTLNQVQKLTTLVNDLLDVSKIEAGKLQFVFHEFDIRKVVDEVIELIGHSANNFRISLETSVEHCLMQADSQRIEQVLINLLTNAIKYSPAGSNINIALCCTGDEVEISVTDHGIGIAPDKHTKIFSRFYRIEDNNPNVSGLGIGLYLSHEIITRHQGKLWVESEPGQGSTFYIRLPIRQAEIHSPNED